MRKILCYLLSVTLAASLAFAADVNLTPDMPVSQPISYYWQAHPVGISAELLTLFCKACTAGREIPLIAVLRDTLGDTDAANDRLTYVWLLDYSPLNWRQRSLAAVPFFYWKVGRGSPESPSGEVKPLLNVEAPLHPMLSEANRSLLQWALFDPMTTAVRATSRAYRENATDYERLHLEQAISYLSQAPNGPVDANGRASLKQSDINLLIARLSLRKRLLGGLVANDRASAVGEQERIAQERVRVRNWELLRQSAEKTGLVFQPLSLSGAQEDYALLWFREDATVPPPSTTDVGPLWKILNIQNPWKDERIRNWHGLTTTRILDGASANGDSAGQKPVRLIPLAAYNLNYPRMPLLMVDFRSEAHVRRHEMLQRGVNQLVSGVIGLSHFANWYYFVGADAYTFVSNRHGSAQNTNARLDCYSQFRAQLALDTRLPSDLRKDMQQRLDALAINPLESEPALEIQTANLRLSKLQAAADNGKLEKQLDLERRAEIADFKSGTGVQAWDAFLHAASFGLYTHRASTQDGTLATLDRDRRVETNLTFLHRVAAAGTQPEIAFNPAQVDASVNELSALLPAVHSSRMRASALEDLKTIRDLTTDEHLKADCLFALRATHGETGAEVASEPRAVNRGVTKVLDPVK